MAGGNGNFPALPTNCSPELRAIISLAKTFYPQSKLLLLRLLNSGNVKNKRSCLSEWHVFLLVKVFKIYS